MNVVFFRHGPAVPRGKAGVAESERPLTAEGRKKTRLAAKGLKMLDLGIDAIYTSPLVRAVQTAEILGERLKLKVEPIDELRPGAPPRRLIAWLAKASAKTPVLVGHEPMLSSSVALAVSGTVKGSIELKKAGLAFVSFSRARSLPEATLQLLLTPIVLRTLGS